MLKRRYASLNLFELFTIKLLIKKGLKHKVLVYEGSAVYGAGLQST